MRKLFGIVAAMFLMTVAAKAEEVYVVVDLSEQVMLVQTPYDNFTFDVSTGRKGYRTPTGTFQPYLMKKMHYSSKYENAPMPNSIFFHGGYAIHATEAVGKLGRPASHGCIRLHPQNARWLYKLVSEFGQENTFIEIVE